MAIDKKIYKQIKDSLKVGGSKGVPFPKVPDMNIMGPPVPFPEVGNQLIPEFINGKPTGKWIEAPEGYNPDPGFTINNNAHENIDRLINSNLPPNILHETSIAYQNPNATLYDRMSSSGQKDDSFLDSIVNKVKNLIPSAPTSEQTGGTTGGLINALLRGVTTGSYDRDDITPLLKKDRDIEDKYLSEDYMKGVNLIDSLFENKTVKQNDFVKFIEKFPYMMNDKELMKYLNQKMVKQTMDTVKNEMEKEKKTNRSTIKDTIIGQNSPKVAVPSAREMKKWRI